MDVEVARMPLHGRSVNCYICYLRRQHVITCHQWPRREASVRECREQHRGPRCHALRACSFVNLLTVAEVGEVRYAVAGSGLWFEEEDLELQLAEAHVNCDHMQHTVHPTSPQRPWA